MSEPLFSIVIPTRERCGTLGATIRTALEQDASDTEVIVSDNASKDDTFKVVSNLRNSRLKYVRTPKRLSMCDNFEFALRQARGRYVLFIGDDDGLMPRACRRLRELTISHPSPLYYWRVHDYRWPERSQPAIIRRSSYRRSPRVMNLVKLAHRAVLDGGWTWGALPRAYHYAVARDLLIRLADQTGRVFHSTLPDVFTAFALPAFAPYAIDVGESLSINGSSTASTGRASMESVATTTVSPLVATFLSEYDGYTMTRDLWPGASYLNLIADAIVMAMSMFPAIYQGIDFNYDAFLAGLTVRRPWLSIPRYSASIIRRRREIRRTQPFSIGRYLWYTARFKAAMRLDRWLEKSSGQEVSGPRDIWECAQLLQEELGSPKAVRPAA